MYIIDNRLLQKGDIILERHEEGDESLVRESNIIQRRSESNYSHAMLYMGDGSVMESHVEGVQSNNIQRRIYYRESEVLVLRAKDKPFCFEERIEQYARRMAMQGYSDKDYKHTIDKPDEPSEPNRQFCTRFVALAYENAGISLTDNPNYANAGDIERSTALNVVGSCTRLATEEEVSFAESDGVINHQADYNAEMLNCIRIAVNNDEIQTIEQLVEFVKTHQEYDQIVSDIIKNSKYYTMWQVMEEEKPWEYDAALMKEKYGPQIHAAAVEYKEMALNAISRFENMQCQFMLLDYEYDLETFSTFWNLYKDLVSSSKKRLAAANDAML